MCVCVCSDVCECGEGLYGGDMERGTCAFFPFLHVCVFVCLFVFLCVS